MRTTPAPDFWIPSPMIKQPEHNRIVFAVPISQPSHLLREETGVVRIAHVYDI